MNIDNGLMFSDAQAVTATAASTNVIDTLAAGDAIAEGLWVVAEVDTAFTAAGAATLQVDIETSATDFGTATVLGSTGAVAVASLTKGATLIKAKLPLGCLRYVRLNYTVATGPMTAGKINAVLTDGVDKTFAVQ